MRLAIYLIMKRKRLLMDSISQTIRIGTKKEKSPNLMTKRDAVDVGHSVLLQLSRVLLSSLAMTRN